LLLTFDNERVGTIAKALDDTPKNADKISPKTNNLLYIFINFNG